MRLMELGAPSCIPVTGWRISSWSNPSGNCVELALVPAARHPEPPDATGMDELKTGWARRQDQ
jgi:hypothetical protein